MLTDSYKVGHSSMYPQGTEHVLSYGEARVGAFFKKTLFFDMQRILKKYLVGKVVTKKKIQEAKAYYKDHFDDGTVFNEAGWNYILEKHNGRLPVHIRAVKEGSMVPVGNVLFTIENTDKNCAWLTNFLESLILHVWYASTVATLSKDIKDAYSASLAKTSDLPSEIQTIISMFALHDFGFRGVSSVESAEAGGAAHLINFMGTDTVPAMYTAKKYYKADTKTLAKSVNATEHSIMTSRGEVQEFEQIEYIIKKFNKGILSMVGDSYSIVRFVDEYIRKLKDVILTRVPNDAGLCKFVVRPDSLRYTGDTPEEQMLYLWERMANIFGYTVNSKGYKVINPKVGLIWGDGIGPDGIKKILELFEKEKICVSSIVFGMGGGLLQKVNRDTQRWAIKSCAQMRDGLWFEVIKNPLDASKKSKSGFLNLEIHDGEYKTVSYGTDRVAYEKTWKSKKNALFTVFKNGYAYNKVTFEQVRANSNKKVA